MNGEERQSELGLFLQARRQESTPESIGLLSPIDTRRRVRGLRREEVAAALYTDFSEIPEQSRNYIRLIFTDQAMRERIQPWDSSARECVTQLHMEVARDQRDPQLIAMVGELSVADVDFRRWWSDHRVAARHSGTKTFRHPVVGDLTLNWGTLTVAGDPDQQLITFTAEPGSTSDMRLRELAAQIEGTQ